MKKTMNGFTIVELLIVIVVIGILAGITIVAFGGIQERAQSLSIITRARSYIKAAQLAEINGVSLPSLTTCIAPSNYSQCDVAYWNVSIPRVAAANATLAEYSGISTPVLGKYTVGSGGGLWDSPAGLMAMAFDWYGSGKLVLMYTVGPNSDCVLGPLLASNHTSLAPTGQNYTIRASTYTRCEILLN